MAPLKVLICGAGIAGPALAFWLNRHGHDVTVVERSRSLRTGGQQIDIRGQGVGVMRKMGMEAAVRAASVDEDGMEMVDSRGRRMACAMANKTGKGRQSTTSEFEIMHDDLCRILYDMSKDRTTYVFGVHVTSLQQDGDDKGSAGDGKRRVAVRFSDGREDRFDLVVGADGQASRTRRMMLGPDAADPFRSLGVYIAYFSIPDPLQEQEAKGPTLAQAYHAGGGLVAFSRRDNPRTRQVGLLCSGSSAAVAARLGPAMKLAGPGAAVEQRAAWADVIRGKGWRCDEIADALLSAPADSDFHTNEVGQVRMDGSSWSRGRVVLLGDAGYCPAPITGLGTSSALVGAYVLAGELQRHFNASASASSSAPSDDDGVLAALRAYDDGLRPFVTSAQTVSPYFALLALPQYTVHVWALRWFAWLFTTLRLDRLLSRLGSDDVGGWALPEYPEL